ncbi:MAG TPA: 3-dehydroquinate synthase II [Nitrososphaerales archaeon]
MTESKEIIVQIRSSQDRITPFVRKSMKEGVKLFLCRKNEVEYVKKAGGKVISDSDDADIVLVSNRDDAISKKRGNRVFALNIKAESNKDIETAISISKMGAKAVIVETGDWKIIPLENLVAGTHKVKTSIYAVADSAQQVPTMFSILELGVDGVVLATDNIADVKQAMKSLSARRRIELTSAKVIEVRNVGVGDRVCLDTASILNKGEGILVGSQAKNLFLVHNESSGSKFTSPRPFRVNAGSIHSYVLLPDGKTKYLSELESGDEVLAVDFKGNSRTVLVGRVKIERRPLMLIKVSLGEGVGSILLQNAETIPLIDTDGKLIPVTELKVGDNVLIKTSVTSGRHFGVAVNEFVLEK